MVESNCTHMYTHIIMAACVQSYSSRMCLRWLSVNLDVLPESYIQYHPLSFYLSASHVNTATLTVIPQVGMVLFVWTAWTPLPSVSHFSTFSSSLSFFTSSLFPSHPLICPVSHHLEAVSPVLSLLHIFKMPTPLFFSFLWQHTHTHTYFRGMHGMHWFLQHHVVVMRLQTHKLRSMSAFSERMKVQHDWWRYGTVLIQCLKPGRLIQS